jgi:hypothetical protein
VQARQLSFKEKQEDSENAAGNEEILQMVQKAHDA